MYIWCYCPQELQYNSLHFKIKLLHTNHVSSLHITALIYVQKPLEFHFLVTTFLTVFLNVFSLQGKDASKPAGNWFQLLTLTLLTWRIWWAANNASKWQMGFNSAFKWLMFLFTKEYLPASEHSPICIVHGHCCENLKTFLTTILVEFKFSA